MSDENTETSADIEVTDEQVSEFFENPPADETKPEAKAEQEPEPEPEEKPEETRDERLVPIHALHEERARRKELTQKVQAMEARFQQMLENLNKQPEPELPKFEENPAANLHTRLSQLEQYKQQVDQQTAQQRQLQEQQANWHNLVTNYQQSAQVYAQANPDFPAAYNHWTDSRMNELQAGGYTPQEAAHIMSQEEAAVVYRAMQNEINPAEQMFKLAKARGFKPAPKPADKMDAIEKGQKSKSLSGGGGKAPDANSLEALAAMDDAEFLANWDKLVGGN